jgi:hypothetical protein
MVLEIYYLDYLSGINQTHQLNYVNINPIDKIEAKTTINNHPIYNQDGTVGGSVKVTSFTSTDDISILVTSMFSIFTDNGLLNFNFVRKYDDKYNPMNDFIVSKSNYASGSYLTENPVTMIIEIIGDYPNIVFKISLVY